jgi:hypothetical protein
VTSLYLKQYERRDPPRFIKSEQDLAASGLEGFSAANEMTVMEEISTSKNNALEPFLYEQAQAVEEILGEPITPVIDQPWSKPARELFSTGELSLDQDRKLVASSPRAKLLLNNSNPTLLRQSLLIEEARRIAPDRVLTPEQMDAKVEEKLGKRRAELQEIMSRSSFGPIALGTMAGVMQDPAVLATLPLGMGWQAGRMVPNFVRAFGSEFLLGASVESVIQQQVYEFKQEINSPYSSGQAILNVLAAGFGSGVVRATGGLAIDIAVELRRGLANRNAARILDEAGISPEAAQRVLDEVESRLATAGSVDPLLHSSAIDRAVQSMDEGRLPEGVLGGAESLEQAALRSQANDFLTREAEALLPEAGNRLSRGEREGLNLEMSQLEFRIAQLQSEGRLQELTQARRDRGETGRKAKQGAAKDQKADVQRVQEDLDRVKGRLEADEKAREAERNLSRLEQDRRKDPVEAAVKRGFKQTSPVRDAVQRAAKEALQASVPYEARNLDAQRIAGIRQKPKVDKGDVPPALRAPEGQEAPAPMAEAPDASRASPAVRAEDIPDAQVVVGERADGSPEIMSSKEAAKMLDSELDAIERVETCLLRGE